MAQSWSRAPSSCSPLRAVGPKGWGLPWNGEGGQHLMAIGHWHLCVAETAMNIGYACKLLTDDMEILEEKEIR